MGKTFILNIQSISDVITNSSSEVFVINSANDSSIQVIKELFEDSDKKGTWNYGGEVCGLQIWNLHDDYLSYFGGDEDGMITIYEKSDNFDAIAEKFGDYFDYEYYDEPSINVKQLVFEQYVELCKLIYDDSICEDAIFLQFDHGNPEFEEKLRNLGFNPINIT